jgi:heptosyltransferase-3
MTHPAPRPSENPTSLTLRQWLDRARRLPVMEVFRRLRGLAVSVPRSFFALNELARTARQQGKTLQCLILTDRLGDIIAAEPVARHVRDNGKLTVWLVQKRYQDLLRYNPNIDLIQTVSSYTETILLRQLLPKIEWRDLHFDGYLCDRFGLRAHNPIARGVNSKNYYDFGPLCDVFALTGTGIFLNTQPTLYPDPSFNAEIYSSNKFSNNNNIIIAHFVSDETVRSWSADEARALQTWLLEHTRLNILELGLAPVLPPGPRTHQLKAELPLMQQAALFAHATLFIGIDSGFAHMANAAGTPSVLLLGKYKSFGDYTPWRIGPRDIILRAPLRPTDISASEVIAAIGPLLQA